METSTVHRLALNLIALVAFVGLWKGYTVVSGVPAHLVPPPEAILKSFIHYVQMGELQRHLAVTLTELAYGTLYGGGAGLVLGYLVAKSPPLERMLLPPLLVAQTAPKISLAPLLLLWFGLGISSKVVLVALVAFFPVMIQTILGIRSIDQNTRYLLKLLRVSRLRTFWSVEVPAAMPYLFLGLRVMSTQIVVGAVVGELIGAKAGLGYLLILGNETYDSAMVITAVFVLSLIGVILYQVVVLLEKRLLFWHESQSE